MSVCDKNRQTVRNEILFQSNDTRQSDFFFLKEFPLHQANKHTNTTFKRKMSEKKKKIVCMHMCMRVCVCVCERQLWCHKNVFYGQSCWWLLILFVFSSARVRQPDTVEYSLLFLSLSPHDKCICIHYQVCSVHERDVLWLDVYTVYSLWMCVHHMHTNNLWVLVFKCVRE